MSSDRDDAQRVEELFDEYLLLRAAGVRFEDWIEGHREHEPALRTLYERYEAQGSWEADLSPPLSPTAFFHVSRLARTPDSQAEVRRLDLRPGELVADFRLVRRLGEGGMGEVWEAEQLTLRRRVALKFMQPRADESRSAGLFEREARAGARLNHPGIIAVYQTGEDRGMRWIAQELVEGGSTLHDFLRSARNSATLPPGFDRDVAELFRRIAAALQVAHTAGVLHRDLKPRNVLITPDGEPKIGDFGLARIVGEPTQIETGAVAGTYTYMSPEQIEGAGIDGRTDVFSLGVVLYEVLAGRRPFEGESRDDVLVGITLRDPVDPRELRRTIPPELAVICMHALEKRPAERFSDAGALADELERYLRDEPILTRPPGPLRRLRKWARRHPAATVAGGVAAAALLAIVPLVGSAADARRSERDAQRQQHFERAGHYFAVMDVEQGLAQAALGIDLEPDDPTGYLVAAAGLTHAGRLSEAEEQLDRARACGFRFDPALVQTPAEHLALGLYVIVRRETGEYARALEHLEQAALDSRIAPLAHYPMYSLRRATGDEAGALEALDRYLAMVPSGAPMHGVLRAERAELAGEPEQALAELDAVAAAHAGALARVPMEHRRGRVLLSLGRLDEAQAALERALEENGSDSASMLNLARVHHDRAAAPGCPADLAAEQLDAARELLDRALERDPGSRTGWALLGKLGLMALVESIDERDPRDDPQWARLEESIERLRELDPDGRQADQLESGRALLEGRRHELGGSYADARAAYQLSATLSPDQPLARMRLARLLCQEDEYERAEAPLREARAIRARDPATERLDPAILRQFELDLLAVAVRNGDRDVALEASDALLARLSAGEMEFGPADPTGGVEQLYLAHSLAISDDEEVRDADLARQLLEQVAPFLSAFGDPEIDRMIAEAEEACR